MCKKQGKKLSEVTSGMLSKSLGNSSVTVTVNVTNIVKYIAWAGIAIVGIIFGTKCLNEYLKNKEKEEE